MFVLFQPVWLLLLVPLAAAWFAWPLPARALRWVRAGVFVLIVLALARLAVKLPDRTGTVVVVADRSESMPPNAATSEKEMIDLLHQSMKPRDLLGVVSFGRTAAIENSPQRSDFGGFTAQVGPEQSSLNDAIDTALSLIPSSSGGRLLVISDGKWTGKDPSLAAARAAGRNVAVDYRVLGRPQIQDLAIQSFQAPDSVLSGQTFILSGWVQSPVQEDVQYELRRGNQVISSGTKSMTVGLNRLMFRDRAGASGVNEYVLKVKGSGDDPMPENNEARTLVGVDGSRPLLLVSDAGEQSGLLSLLRAGGVDVVGKLPTQCQWSLEDLSQYSGVLVENVPAGSIGMVGMESLASWVEGTGSGFMMTGGQKSYGPGGYFKSPLERVLPISMEMRSEHRKLQLAIAVSLDRSGSMAVPVSGGRIKMDLADLGTVQVLDLLSPLDEISVTAVDTVPHEIVPMDSVEKNRAYRQRILQIDSMGGGIYIYEALVAAARSVTAAKAKTKHIILFADANDSEETGDYKNLIQNMRDSDVSVSVIGLGTERDQDADLLKDIARRGNGDCYFTDNPEEIPRLFAQDTFTVARSTFVEEPTGFNLTGGWSLLGGPLASAPPKLGGYNLCYLRPEANLAAVTIDSYAAPVVASWQAGNGRVLCYMGEADGKFTGDIDKWDQTGEFFSTLARWTAGHRQSLPEDLLLQQHVRDGVCQVQLYLDPQRKGDPFTSLPKVRSLHGLAGHTPSKNTVTLEWKTADMLEVDIPIAGRETVLNTVEISGQQPVMLPPVCLPYSPEFAPEQPGRGARALEQIAATTGGRERAELSAIWNDLPINSRYVELTPWLLVSATFLFLIEILERRTGWLGRLFGVKKPVATAVEEAESESNLVHPPRTHKAAPPQKEKPLTEPTATNTDANQPATPSAPVKPAATDSLDALRKARDRASRRVDKKQ